MFKAQILSEIFEVYQIKGLGNTAGISCSYTGEGSYEIICF